MNINMALFIILFNFIFIISCFSLLNDVLSSKTAILGETKFSRIPPMQFKKQYLMRPLEKPYFTSDKYLNIINNNNSIPESFDWRDYGAVTPVKDQGTVGSCWAFSTTGNIEGQWFLNKNELISLSEEFLVDCDSNDCGVFGGWPYLSMQFVISVKGIPSEEAYPYCSGTGECFPCMANKNKTFCGPPPSYCNITWDEVHCPTQDWQPAATIDDWMAISTDETIIAQVLYEIGPLSVLMDATGLQYYKSGIWDGGSGLFKCTKTDLDHAVLIVGYGTSNGTDYWTVKNSWGSDWGENGYFRIVRGVGECGINTQVTTSCVTQCQK